MNVLELTRVDPCVGDVGVEIEMEASNMPPQDAVQGWWKLTSDSSLRGESGEFVLRRPQTLPTLSQALDELSNLMRDHNTQFNPTYRAGVHVHVNVQQMNLRQLITFCATYFILEEILLSWCDRSRQGNHFCLRAKDATHVLDVFTNAIRNSDFSVFNDENIRYSSMNFNSLYKYGSIEFRALESTADFERIHLWAAMLVRLRDYAMTVAVPTDLLGQASLNGFTEFAREALGPFADVLSQHITEERVRAGIRAVQYSLYAHPWGQIDHNIFSKKSNLFS